MDGGAPALTLKDFFDAWELFRDPVWAGVIAGGTLGYLGVYIVLRRMVFVSAALSQAAGLGVATAFWAQIVLGVAGAAGDPTAYAMAFTLVAMLLLVRSGTERWVSRESILGVVYLVGSAGALIVGTKIRQEAHDIQAILFGTAVLVKPEDLRLLEMIAAVTLALHVLFGRGYRLASFDRDGALIRGLPVRFLDATLLASIAIAVSVATRVLGALPVFAFSVLPAVAAVLVAPNVRAALVLAAVIGAGSGAIGYGLAFLRTWPVGASQAVVAVCFALAMGAIRLALGSLVGARRPRRSPS